MERLRQNKAISVLGPELSEDLMEMEFDGSLRETEAARNLLIRQARDYQPHNFSFTWGQPL